MRPQIRYAILIAVLLLIWASIHLASREPVENEPRLLAGSPVHQVLDLQTAPTGITGTADDKTIEIPGNPQRYLVASLTDGKIALGWSSDPGAAPAQSAYVATTGECLIGWVAKEDRDLVRVKASASIASDTIVTSIELHLQR